MSKVDSSSCDRDNFSHCFFIIVTKIYCLHIHERFNTEPVWAYKSPVFEKQIIHHNYDKNNNNTNNSNTNNNTNIVQVIIIKK